MVQISRIIIFLIMSLLLSNCQIAKNDCDRITQAAWLEIESQIKDKNLTGEAIELLVFNKNKELQAVYPSCFTEEILSAATPPKSSVKLDSKGLKDEEILEINKRYQNAEKICIEELRNAFKEISDEELSILIHDCTMDRIVNNNLTK